MSLSQQVVNICISCDTKLSEMHFVADCGCVFCSTCTTIYLVCLNIRSGKRSGTCPIHMSGLVIRTFKAYPSQCDIKSCCLEDTRPLRPRVYLTECGHVFCKDDWEERRRVHPTLDAYHGLKCPTCRAISSEWRNYEPMRALKPVAAVRQAEPPRSSVSRISRSGRIETRIPKPKRRSQPRRESTNLTSGSKRSEGFDLWQIDALKWLEVLKALVKIELGNRVEGRPLSSSFCTKFGIMFNAMTQASGGIKRKPRSLIRCNQVSKDLSKAIAILEAEDIDV